MSTGLFNPLADQEVETSGAAATAKPVAELAAARFRARGGYTEPAPSPQASNDRFANYLNEPESRKGQRRGLSRPTYVSDRTVA